MLGLLALALFGFVIFALDLWSVVSLLLSRDRFARAKAYDIAARDMAVLAVAGVAAYASVHWWGV